MLTIRDAQIEAFQRDLDLTYIARLAERLRVDNPAIAAGMDDNQLQQGLLDSLRRGRRFGIEAALDVMAFFAATIRLSPRFDSTPSAIALLSDQTLSQSERLYRVSLLVPALVRAEAAGLPA
ncbi:hypothetical protein HSX11_09030 [Oxalobacteraceae bacterium]|nr:hypothetical protein [Oxalobacteraceae bacterium]